MEKHAGQATGPVFKKNSAGVKFTVAPLVRQTAGASNFVEPARYRCYLRGLPGYLAPTPLLFTCAACSSYMGCPLYPLLAQLNLQLE